MSKKDNIELTDELIKELRNIFDPEIPVNIYDLGLIYEINVDNKNNVKIVMTLTAPNCPMADMLVNEVKEKIGGHKEVNKFDFELTFDPPWTAEMLTEEAKLELGLL